MNADTQKRHDELMGKFDAKAINDAELLELRDIKRAFIKDHFVFVHVK